MNANGAIVRALIEDYHDDESSESSFLLGVDGREDSGTRILLRRRAYRNICHGNKPTANAMMMTAHQFISVRFLQAFRFASTLCAHYIVLRSSLGAVIN